MKFCNSRKFFSKFTQTQFFGRSGKFSEICTSLDEKGKFTCSCQNQGRFTHSCNRKVVFSRKFFQFTHSRNFFRLSHIHATNKAYSQYSRKPLGALEYHLSTISLGIQALLTSEMQSLVQVKSAWYSLIDTVCE